MTTFSHLFKGTIVVLDGGLGTTLQDVYHKTITGNPLWSAQWIEEDPEVIIQTHLDFLRSGAKVILTSTYQCAYTTFELAGQSRSEADATMRKSVALASEARTRFLNEQTHRPGQPPLTQGDIRIALSLGSFGANIEGGHEVDGIYPPPYGPAKPAAAFSPAEHTLATQSVDALAFFHLERLRIFVADPETWAHIDCLAFESVPVAREVTAIRKAIRALQEEVGGDGFKPWWIGLIFPSGEFPDTDGPGGSPLRPRDIIAAASAVDGNSGDQGKLPLPSGLGINCTSISFFPRITKEFGEAIGELWDKEHKPWLVMYPNGGFVFDPIARKFSWDTSGPKRSLWAEEMHSIVVGTVNNEKGNPWGGVIAGGCCKTSSEDIQHLAKSLDAQNAVSRL